MGVVLTGNFHEGGLTSDLASAGPGDAVAVEGLLAKVLLDLIPCHVALGLHNPHP